MKKYLLQGLFLVSVTCLSAAAHAQQETVLYSFTRDANPHGNMIIGGNGLLYGTTVAGQSPLGTAFVLQEKNNVWRERPLIKFDDSNGALPYSALTQDSSGNTYGTTSAGGANGKGTVFELTGPNANTILYSFAGGSDGETPNSALHLDRKTGTFYGVTTAGGANGCGILFQLTQSGGTWTESTVYTFKGGSDGCNPSAPPHETNEGILHGVTLAGGPSNDGTVYELTEKGGVWSESVLYSFTGGANGAAPVDLDLDLAGDLIYGVASAGGTSGNGLAFQLKKARGAWRQSVIYNFNGSPDGSVPVGLSLDRPTGVLYGTTLAGGTRGRGTLFELSKRNVSSPWSESLLHTFGVNSGDGASPESRPTLDTTTGNLFGTTGAGGQFGGGTAYMVVP